METLKNYLDTMFAVLPDTDEVRQAKVELFQMMEDRYSDLISEGKSENEAVGAVITEFGSIDEIAKALGLDLPKKEDASDADKKEDSAKTIGAEKEEGRTNEADSRYDFGSGCPQDRKRPFRWNPSLLLTASWIRQVSASGSEMPIP